MVTTPQRPCGCEGPQRCPAGGSSTSYSSCACGENLPIAISTNRVVKLVAQRFVIWIIWQCVPCMPPMGALSFVSSYVRARFRDSRRQGVNLLLRISDPLPMALAARGAAITRPAFRSTTLDRTSIKMASGNPQLAARTFWLDTFALRQWDDQEYQGTRIAHDKADFVSRVQAAHDGGAPLVDGYAPFCKVCVSRCGCAQDSLGSQQGGRQLATPPACRPRCCRAGGQLWHSRKHCRRADCAPAAQHVFLPNFTGATVGSLAITPGNRHLLRSGYTKRRPEELAVLTRCAPHAAPRFD